MGSTKAELFRERLRSGSTAAQWSDSETRNTLRSALHVAPEVFAGQHGAPADIFSFGILITEVLAAQDAEDIIDATRTESFGLSPDGVRSLLKPGVHPAGCGKLVDVALA